MSADEAAKSQWVARVLGVQVDDAGQQEKQKISASEQRAREAAALNKRGVAYPTLLLRWRDAQSDARAQLNSIGSAYYMLPNVQADPRINQVKQALAGLPSLIPKFSRRGECGQHAGRGACGNCTKPWQGRVTWRG